jgi:hypothetical protein
VRAELVAHAPEGVAPGKPLWLGLLIEHQPHWHTYWKNPGDSGLPTTLEWQLPPAGHGRRHPVAHAAQAAHRAADELRLRRARCCCRCPCRAGRLQAGSWTVKLHADWLVCKDVCIPESGEFTLDLPVQAATAAHAALFDAAQAARAAGGAGARPVPASKAATGGRGGGPAGSLAGPRDRLPARDHRRHPERRQARAEWAGDRWRRACRWTRSAATARPHARGADAEGRPPAAGAGGGDHALAGAGAGRATRAGRRRGHHAAAPATTGLLPGLLWRLLGGGAC